MKITLVNSSLMGAAVIIGLAARPVDDSVKLRFAPAVGTVLEHEVVIKTEIEGGDLAVKMDGSDVPAQYLPELSFALETTTSVTVSDEFVEAEDGIKGPWRKRAINSPEEAFAMEMAIGDDSFDVSADGSSELDGEAFLIGRDEEGETVARWSDEGSSLSSELLESQKPQFDLDGLLADGEVSVGDSWEADASALANVIDVSRQLPWTWSSSDGSDIPDAGIADWSGGLDLTVDDVTTEGEELHCTISITGEAVEVVTKPGDLSQVPVAEGDATETTTTTYQLEGMLTWNVTAGHLHSLTLEGEGEGEQLTEKDAGQPGPEYQSTTQHTSKLSVELK